MKAVVLVSGGMDSFYTLALATKKVDTIYPLAFEYGQRHRIELEYAKEHVAYARGIGAHVEDLAIIEIIGLFKTKLAGNLEDDGEWNSSSGNDRVYIPNRNAVMAMLAASYAERVDANEVWMGLIAGDGDTNKNAIISPDASPEFVTQVNKLLKVSTRDVEVEVIAPLVEKSKQDVVRGALKMGVPIINSWSCFDPQVGEGGHPEVCGKCPACVSRAVAFAGVGVRGQ